MKKLIAQWSFGYAGKDIREGQPFEADDADAELMLARGSAIEDHSERRSKRSYKRRDMTAEVE